MTNGKETIGRNHDDLRDSDESVLAKQRGIGSGAASRLHTATRLRRTEQRKSQIVVDQQSVYDVSA